MPLERNIVNTDVPHNWKYIAENAILFDHQCDDPRTDDATLQSYFLLQDAVVNKGFVIDAGAVMDFTRFYIRNTHNTIANDR